LGFLGTGYSPGYVMKRRRKVPDSLGQARIAFFTNLKPSNENQHVPSEGIRISWTSGGPLVQKKSERGYNRGFGDQVRWGALWESGRRISIKWKDLPN
jgi:hypothetical protein